MSMVLQFFVIRFANLSFYTKHMFKFIYVNQLIHMVILVDNVDKLKELDKRIKKTVGNKVSHRFFIKIF